jgi:hypothetical protein
MRFGEIFLGLYLNPKIYNSGNCKKKGRKKGDHLIDLRDKGLQRDTSTEQASQCLLHCCFL